MSTSLVAVPAFSSLRIEHDARERRIARLRLSRPERLNAIDMKMPGEIRAFDHFEARRGFHHGDGGLVQQTRACLRVRRIVGQDVGEFTAAFTFWDSQVTEA